MTPTVPVIEHPRLRRRRAVGPRVTGDSDMRSMLRLASVPLSALALALTLPSAGCKPPEYPECKKDKHCKQDLGEKCVDGKCQNCVEDADCAGKGPNGEDWTCFELRCVDPAEVPGG